MPGNTPNDELRSDPEDSEDELDSVSFSEDSDSDSASGNVTAADCTGKTVEGSTSSDQQMENEDVEEEEDDLVKAIRREQGKKERDHPPDIQCDDYIVDICFHPEEDLITAANIVGDVLLYKFTNETVDLVETIELHEKACRDVEFSNDGQVLYSTSKDKSILLTDMKTLKLRRMINEAHSDPVYCLCVLDENMLASGDDNGVVKLWDIRKEEPLFSLKEMDDYVSCMISTEAKKFLVCASGEGTITSINLRSRKLHLQSELYEAELNCMGLIRSDTKLLVGSSKGRMYLFNWGEFGYHSDEFPGLKKSINSLVPITENIVVTASEDGILRATNLFPHRQLGIVGQHRFPVERLDISSSGHLIASTSHDQIIKFWNIQYFEEMEVKEKSQGDKKKVLQHNLPSSKYKNVSDFFSGLKEDS